MKYRKKPVVVEVVKFDRKKAESNHASDYPMVIDIATATTAYGITEREDRFYINTLEGSMTVSDGDYIIKGVLGEYYPCKPESFEQTYEKVN